MCIRDSYGEAKSSINPIEAGVPQGSVLGPHLYLLFTSDIPTHPQTLTATFADDIALASPHEDYNVAVNNLQVIADDINEWTKDWKIKLNRQIIKSGLYAETARIDANLYRRAPNKYKRQCQIFWSSYGPKTHMEDALSEKTR